ncbi:alpha-amylase family glycosyl hydrolase [Bacteroidia bacterium]|nr:alpha-amylase family glycosyl hydrolase [Bacteroidia bacterium]MDB9883093.1 alpha-amylase family glycosyl hydrolase [Bacteroidia bacterium]
MNKILFLSAVALIVFACNKSNAAPKDSKIYGLASPIQLVGNITKVVIEDYFTEEVLIDSVVSDDDIKTSYNSDYIFLVSQGNIKPLSNLTIYAEGISYSILVVNKKTKTTSVRINKNLITANILQITGEFNNWLPTKMSSDNENWFTQLELKPGKYQYKLIADGKEIDDPSNPSKISNGMGGFNNVRELEGPDKANFPEISTESFTKSEIILSTSKTENVYAYWNNFRIEAKKEGNKIKLLIPPFAKYEIRSHIRIFGYNHVATSNDLLIPLAKGNVITDASKLNNSDWHSSIMYFMMVDRFVDGDSTNNHPVKDSEILPKAQYYGGDIKGITQKIESGYFKNLNINTIWVSPITQNPLDAWGQFHEPETKFSGYHGYWPITSTTVDYRLGSSADVKEMLRVAHKSRLSVLLDYVANHVHEQHPVYQNHKDWVTPLYLPDGTMNTEKWDEYRLTTWFDTFLPTLDLRKQEVTDFMVDSAIHWITEYDFDGFRHDATKHISNNFWRTLNKKVKAVSKEKRKYIYQIGETYGTHDLINSYIGSGLLDAQFDFNMYDNALPVFATQDESMTRLGDALEASLSTYGHHHLMGNITGNQDKPRFISFADGSLSFDTPWMEYKRIGWNQNIEVQDSLAYRKMAMFNAFNMTIPGIPIIYYGDEIGMAGAGDPDNRRMMRFENLKEHETALQKEIAELTTLRNTNMALLYGDFEILENTDKELIYERKYFDNEVLITLDKSTWTYSIKVGQ